MENLESAVNSAKTSWMGLLTSQAFLIIGNVTQATISTWMGIISTLVVTLYTIWKWRQDYLKTKKRR